MTTLKLVSWNVNGIRAVHRKKALSPIFENLQPDVLCLQEIKAQADDLPKAVRDVPGYELAVTEAEKKGYSGLATYSKITPVSVRHGLGIDEFDVEGRTQVLEFEAFTLINAYFPSGTTGQERIDYKLAYYEAFLDFADSLRALGKPVIFCGDVNTSHQEIDLARPKQNRKTSGFMPEERAWIDKVVAHGYVDTLRLLHPDTPELYSWWAVRSGARKRNVGWRLDYIFVSDALRDSVQAADVHMAVMGSDHCPVSVTLTL